MRTEKEKREKERLTGMGVGKGINVMHERAERQRRRDRRGSARVTKVDYILLSQPATCCTLGRTGLPGKSNHR